MSRKIPERYNDGARANDLEAPMEFSPTTETDTEHLKVADFDASTGENPDPTGDFASGRTHVFLDTDEFLAFLDHCHKSATGE